ncbi:MAG: glycoside hydrolase family 15 protein [Rhodocyclaceae bacterium]|jgi:GH15 family glucan-1,4-alpha-glucosidase|nr:glycoside hydrolase family 15 protein [Rhodocyclaceae bacterium]
MNSLELGLVGNGTIGALINGTGNVVWGCFPRFDGDPAFCALLGGEEGAQRGFWQVELERVAVSEQHYLPNTAVLVTHLRDQDGGEVEITDFAPRFRQYGRMFIPMVLVRRIRRLAGTPRVTLRLRVASDWGARQAEVTWGSNHIRYLADRVVLRLTTNASITACLQELPFFLEDTVTLVLGPDETLQGGVDEVGRHFLGETIEYWRDWVRYLAIPFEWQDAVIRAAITLKLNAFDDTGAIIAAMTTSIPEAPGSERNWDYRHCWLRDGYFVVNALNRLGATRTMERYVRFIANVAADTHGGRLQPVYRIDGSSQIDERIVSSLPGYRGMGPVREGNQASRQAQHDVYGSAVLTAAHSFFDQRLRSAGDTALFSRLEALGEQAVRNFDQPDAGIWELREKARVHTYSSVMCWAACDRLAKISSHLGLGERTVHWREAAQRMRQVILQRAWSEERQSFVASFEGKTLDASLLLLHDLGFLEADDPRFGGTVAAVERELMKGGFVFRYVEADDFGYPHNAFLVCTFWYIGAIAALGRREEARERFQSLLALRNRHGLYGEHIDPATGEQWGNFVQTYSMVGLINTAIRLSIRWDQAF